jgi:F0F1-type ATP synthase epsilon subunit
MADRRLHIIIRTQHEVVFETDATSLRVPTASGQVGLRPRTEATLLAVEAGLMLVHTEGSTRFIGTVGGLLSCDGTTATLLTPLAVTGADAPTMLHALEGALQEPSEEMQARTTLGKLEGEIVHELRREWRERRGPQGAE